MNPIKALKKPKVFDPIASTKISRTFDHIIYITIHRYFVNTHIFMAGMWGNISPLYPQSPAPMNQFTAHTCPE